VFAAAIAGIQAEPYLSVPSICPLTKASRTAFRFPANLLLFCRLTLYIPAAVELTRGGFFYPRGDGTYDTIISAQHILKSFADSHEKQLAGLKLRVPESLELLQSPAAAAASGAAAGAAVSEGRDSLRDLVITGLGTDDNVSDAGVVKRYSVPWRTVASKEPCQLPAAQIATQTVPSFKLMPNSKLLVSQAQLLHYSCCGCCNEVVTLPFTRKCSLLFSALLDANRLCWQSTSLATTVAAALPSLSMHASTLLLACAACAAPPPHTLCIAFFFCCVCCFQARFLLCVLLSG
jgi:hypothetical protein